ASSAVKALVLIGLFATPISLGLQGTDALALGPIGLLSGSVWVTGLATSYGLTTLMILAALMLGFASLFMATGRARLIVAGLAWAGAAFAFSLSGHASAAEPQWITRPAV